ncbi:SDR family oxidoreductase [Streptomyces sp. NPDC059443]|uniref:SDR family oxidoreductase n=1 Tax=unclassified Streptomyces TaxID=2593676 RepID=UPI0036C1241F
MQVALTGATGFLGLRLVRELLGHHDSLTVLAHARSGGALGRITRFMELAGAPSGLIEELPGRLRIVEVDLGQPQMGLPAVAFRQLADELDVIWHSAGNIKLDDDLVRLRQANVEGTRNVLELAAAGVRKPLIHHISTAFVGGARRDGVLYEDELDGTHGFENGYEQSKYEAEVLVHEWSRSHGRPVVVMRPSILVSQLPPHPELPSHPLQFLYEVMQTWLPDSGGTLTEENRPVVRMQGHPHGHLNLMPVEHAAAVMVQLAGMPPSGQVDTYHVVHDHDVPVKVLTTLAEQLVRVQVKLVDMKPEDPIPLEAAVALYPGCMQYLGHRRRFDDTRVRTLLGPVSSGTRVDLEYLTAGATAMGTAVSSAGVR